MARLSSGTSLGRGGPQYPVPMAEAGLVPLQRLVGMPVHGMNYPTNHEPAVLSLVAKPCQVSIPWVSRSHGLTFFKKWLAFGCRSQTPVGVRIAGGGVMYLGHVFGLRCPRTRSGL